MDSVGRCCSGEIRHVSGLSCGSRGGDLFFWGGDQPGTAVLNNVPPRTLVLRVVRHPGPRRLIVALLGVIIARLRSRRPRAVTRRPDRISPVGQMLAPAVTKAAFQQTGVNRREAIYIRDISKNNPTPDKRNTTTQNNSR